MKKSLFIGLLMAFSFLPLLNSCGSYEDPNIDPPADTKYWKLTSSEFHGVEPLEIHSYKQFSQFPFDISYTLAPDGDVYTFSGLEGNVTRSDWTKVWNETTKITFTWSEIPRKIFPDTDYTVTYESKGNTGNGISVSRPVYYGGEFSWFPGSTARLNSGQKSATLRMTSPDNTDPKYQKMKIGVLMASGAFHYMEWWYVYEWVQ
jgi:hypothetical protein